VLVAGVIAAFDALMIEVVDRPVARRLAKVFDNRLELRISLPNDFVDMRRTNAGLLELVMLKVEGLDRQFR
jgi:hypothetical protein